MDVNLGAIGETGIFSGGGVGGVTGAVRGRRTLVVRVLKEIRTALLKSKSEIWSSD